jgi:hypothetical protein
MVGFWSAASPGVWDKIVGILRLMLADIYAELGLEVEASWLTVLIMTRRLWIEARR